MVVVGSGYGASIAASRCARAGQSVCLLERGKEWLPGDFSETFSEATKETQVTIGGKGKKIGMQAFFSVLMFSQFRTPCLVKTVILVFLLWRQFHVPAYFLRVSR